MGAVLNADLSAGAAALVVVDYASLDRVVRLISQDAAALAWLRALDSAEKDRMLLRVLEGDGGRLGWELHSRLRGEAGPRRTKRAGPRRAGALLQRAHVRAAERRQHLEHARAEQQRAEAERRAAARRQHLDRLEDDEPALWPRVGELIATLQPKAYDEALILLADRCGDRADWAARVNPLRDAHAKRPSLRQRLGKLG